MDPKDKENQLVVNLNIQVILTVLLWMSFVVFIIYRLWSSRLVPALSPINVTVVPTIAQENVNTLRSSVKSLESSGLPTVRIEPFD